jgi:hypothetical protein
MLGTPSTMLRRLIRPALALILLLTSVRSDSIPPSQYFDYRLGMVVAGHQFNLAAWELRALAGKGTQILAREASVLSLAERETRVRAFFSRIQHIRDLEGELQRIYSTASLQETGKTSAHLQAELDALRQQQAKGQGLVEAILEDQVGEVLAEEAFAVGPTVWPPVSFRLTHPPTLLIISPREEIARKKEAMLKPHLPLAQRERLEDTIDGAFGVSSLIDNLGGLGAAFPTIVLFSSSILYTVDTIAHEWAHHYLFFNPLGWRYGSSDDLTTMNETAASIVGEEIAREVMLRHYPDLAPPPPTVSDETPSPSPEQETEFDFNRVMRETRLEVDRLLSAGEVEQAEAYMESQRRLVVEHGYYLRKLNQAYFAFHGSYATSPASVDPIGPQMQRLRSASPSLKAFLQWVAQMRSYTDLQQAVQELEAG